MATTLYTPVDGAIGLQLASPYTSGSGSMTLKTGQGAFFVTFPTIVTAITQGTYNTGGGEVLCEYVVTGKSTDTLTGVTAVGGFTDRNFATNDFVEGRVSAVYIANLNTVATADAGNITANFIKAGPTTGAAAVPNYRAQVTADLPSPLYPKFGYDATNTAPQWTAIADPGSPAAGDRWLSTASNSPVDCRFVDGSSNPFLVREDGTFFSCGSCTQLASFTTAASMLAGASNTLGSVTIPGNTLKINQCIEINFLSSWQATSTPTYTFSIYAGTTLLTTGSATIGANGPFPMSTIWPILLWVTAIGSSGSVTSIGQVYFWSATSPGDGTISMASGATGYTPVVINTTSAFALDLRMACSANSSSNTIQMLNCQMRIRG